MLRHLFSLALFLSLMASIGCQVKDDSNNEVVPALGQKKDLDKVDQGKLNKSQSDVNPLKNSIEQKMKMSQGQNNAEAVLATESQVNEARKVILEVLQSYEALEKKISNEHDEVLTIRNLSRAEVLKGIATIKSEWSNAQTGLTKPQVTLVELRLVLGHYYQSCLSNKPTLDKLRAVPELDVTARSLHTKIVHIFEFLFKLENTTDVAIQKFAADDLKVTTANREWNRDRAHEQTRKKLSLANLGEVLDSLYEDVVPMLSQCSALKASDEDIKSLKDNTDEAKKQWNKLKDEEIPEFRLQFKKVVSSLMKLDDLVIEKMLQHEECRDLGTVLGDFVDNFKITYSRFYIDQKVTPSK